MNRLRKLAGSFWVRLVVSAALLIAVATQIDLGAARSRIAAGSWPLYALAVLVIFGSFVVAALRWRIFLRAASLDTARFRALRAYLIGVFTMNFLPSQLGGDVARTYIVRRSGTRVISGVTVVFDRVTALVCLIAVGFLATAVDPHALPGSLLVALTASAGLVIAGGLVAALLLRYGGRVSHRAPARLRVWGSAAATATRACLRRDVVGETIALGLVFQIMVVFGVWLVSRSLEIHLSFAVLAAILPLVLLVSALPISIGGLGVREWSYVVLLNRVGVGATDATILSLAAAVANVVAGLPGAVMLLVRPASETIPPASSRRSSESDRALRGRSVLTKNAEDKR